MSWYAKDRARDRIALAGQGPALVTFWEESSRGGYKPRVRDNERRFLSGESVRGGRFPSAGGVRQLTIAPASVP